MIVLDAVLEHLIASEIGHLMRKSVWRVHFIPCAIYRRSSQIRIAFSALLRLGESVNIFSFETFIGPRRLGLLEVSTNTLTMLR